MGAHPLPQINLENFDPVAEGVFEAILQTFPSVCHTRLRVVDAFERQGRIGQGDYTSIANIVEGKGSLLCAISVPRQTYLNLIRNVFPKEVATEINQDTRDLLLSILRRSLHLAASIMRDKQIQPSAVGQTLIEGANHALYVPSPVAVRVLVCECEQGTVTIQFARFPKEELQRVQ